MTYAQRGRDRVEEKGSITGGKKKRILKKSESLISIGEESVGNI